MELEPLRPGEVVESTDMIGMARLALYINEHGYENLQLCISTDEWKAYRCPTLNISDWRYRIKPKPIERWVVVTGSGLQISCNSRKAAEQEIEAAEQDTASAEWFKNARIVHLVEAPTDSEVRGG